MLCESVRLITNRLAEFQSRIVACELQRFWASLAINHFFFFCQPNDQRRLDSKRLERLKRCAQLPCSAVDQHQIWIELQSISCFSVSTTDHFTNCHEIIIARSANAISAIALFEGTTVDETDFATDRFISTEMCDVNRFKASNG